MNKNSLIFVCAFICAGCTRQPTPIPDFVTLEEYQVYHDLLLENPDMWNVPADAQHMIIFDQSYVRPEPQAVFDLLQNEETITTHLIENFLQTNQNPYYFEDQFNLGVPVTFVSDESIKTLVKGIKFAEQCQYSIEAIYPRPEFGGFYLLSRVGFDAKQKTALMYIEKSICGGNGGFLILKKEAKVWKIVDFVGAFYSDLGLAMPETLSVEEQAVLDAALKVGEELMLSEGYQFLTVFDQTGLADEISLNGTDRFSGINAKLAGVTEDMVNDLLMQNAEPHYLVPDFSLDVSVVLVSWQEYMQISQTMEESACLTTLQDRFPEPVFQGWLRLSRVGFNQERKKALVYLDSFRCKNENNLLYFEKQRDEWVLLDSVSISSLPNEQYFGRILFESNRDGNQEIYMINPDGTDPQNLTNSPAIDFSPAWSPDWNSIAYNSGIDGNAEIFLLDLLTMQSRNITNFPAKDWEADWPPDGSQIVFFTDRDAFSEIYTLQLETLTTQRLTNSDAYERQPAWSPKGDRIAFSSDQDGDWEIYLMDLEGTIITQLTNNEVFDLAPHWSPDGRMLAYSSKQGENWEIYLLDVNTLMIKPLTSHPANDLNPVWSPDGERIAFQSDRDGNLEIYIMNIDGSNQINISNHLANDYNPDW